MDESTFILRCPFPEPEIPDLDVYGYVTQRWADDFEAVAMVDSSNDRQLTYGELNSVINSLSRDMKTAGLRQRDIIAIWSSNCSEVLIVALAAWKCGATVVMIAASLTPNEARHQLYMVNAPFLSVDKRNINKVKDALPNASLQTLFQVGEQHTFLSIGGSDRRPVRLENHPKVNHPDDTAVILFSSGTTGLPKAVELTHRNFVISLFLTSETVTGRSMPTMILFPPMTHFYGLYSALRTLDQGSLLVIMAKFDIDDYLRLVEKHQVYSKTLNSQAIVLFIVPVVATILSKRPELLTKYDLSSVLAIYSAAAPLPPETVRELQRIMPDAKIKARFGQSYGMTETTGAVTRPPSLPYPHVCPHESVGLVVPFVQIKIVDPASGRACGPKTEGELVVRGPTVMKGYLGDPVATSNMIDADGWLHTGDIAYYEDTGFIFIVDRVKELIKHKGLQVAPAELEDALLSHPDLEDAAVVGIPDEMAGECPLAFVVVKAGRQVTEKQIQAFVAGKVAAYKQLTGGVKFVSTIPHSQTGKILRRALRDTLLNHKL